MGIDIGLERSRSGDGAHAWIFFSDPISAKIARQLGTIILSNARAKRHNISLDSYDRFFPSQDTLPNGGFGNLIALPLQRLPRKDGNSVFIDASLTPFPDQWAFLASIRRLSYAEITTFLGISNKQIGIPGVKRSGMIDISTLQTLARSKNILDIDRHYGLIIVDECHHGSAVSFEGVLKLFSTRVMLGLTATPFRKDGDQAIFHMQCGPIRHQMKGPEDSTLTNKRVVVRESHFRMPPESPPQSPIHEVWNQLILDKNRLELISNDIIAAIQSGQFPLILSERKDHLERLYSLVQQKSADTAFKGFLLFGNMGKKERKRIMVGLAQCLEQKEKPCLFSTGSLIGEGFDLPELDTLILAMPISFKGRIIQYVGRINRISQGKSAATVYDYVDINLGLTISMFRKRLPAYKKLGYTVEAPPNTKVSELIKRTRKMNINA